MASFKCWVIDDSDESSAVERECWDASAAAEEHAEESYGDLDYPDEIVVGVINADTGERSRWKVVVEQQPVFTATRDTDSKP